MNKHGKNMCAFPHFPKENSNFLICNFGIKEVVFHDLPIGLCSEGVPVPGIECDDGEGKHDCEKKGGYILNIECRDWNTDI